MSNKPSPRTWSNGPCVAFSVGLLTLLTYGAQAETRRLKCSQSALEKLEVESDTIRSWPKLRSFYRRYSICNVDDAEVTEGVSESVVRLFIDHWNALSVAQRIFSHDAGFESFALAGINITDLTDDLNQIDKLATEHCPSGLGMLCQKIRKATRTND